MTGATPPPADMRPDAPSPEGKRSRARAYAVAGAALAAVALLTWWGWPYISRFLDAEQARRLVEDAGAWGPLVLIGMQVVQVVVAPIPGQITGLVGGYLFGPVLGVVYTTIGATIGFMQAKEMNTFLVYPYGDIAYYRLAIGQFESFALAAEQIEKEKGNFKENLWVLKY